MSSDEHDVWIWGKFLHGGRVGQNLQKHSDKPARLGVKFRAVVAGADFCLAISSSGQLYGWGNAAMLGLADTQAVVCEPQPIDICGAQKIKTAAAGVHQAAAITEDHDLIYWSDQAGPNVAACPPVTMGRFVAVSCGSHHSLALTDVGQLFSWGQGEGGVLGFGHEEDVLEPSPLIVLDPISMTPLVFKSISAGGLHSLAIDAWGRAWAWGFNADGRLGLGASSLFTHLTPTLVTTIRSPNGSLKSVGAGFFVQLSAGYSASAFLDSNGNLYCCGKNEDGVLGLGYVSQNCVFPTAISKLDTTAGPVTSFGVKFVSISVSRYMSAALTENGLLYTFGSSGLFLGAGMNRLGHPSLPSVFKTKPGCNRPMVVSASEKTPFLLVSLGWDNVIALEGMPVSLARPAPPNPSPAAIAPRFLKLYMFGETMTFLFDPDATVRQVLERAGSRIAGFDINKCIPKDSSGQEVPLDLHLRELSGSEIFFKQLRPIALPPTKRFTVHFEQDQKNSILWRPGLVVRDVLEKMCNNRGVVMSHFVAKDMAGNPVDLNLTLEKLIVDEITFNSKANIDTGVRVLLQDKQQHTLRFNGELFLSELLCRVCENRDLCVWKFVPKNVEGALLEPSLPLSQLAIPQNIIDFSTPRTSIWFKELYFATGLGKKAGLELRSAVARCRPRSSQLSSSVAKALDQAIAALSAEFPGYDVISLSDQTLSPQLRPDHPAWLVHVAGLGNLINGLPGVALCISLIKDEKPRVGVVYDVGLADIYFAEENAGAYCGDTEILSVSPKADLPTSLIAAAPFSSDAFDRLADLCPRIRNWGIPELEMCYVARGRLDACVYFNVSMWSIAATSLIVQEALGVIVDVDAPHSPFSVTQTQAIVASNQALSHSILLHLADPALLAASVPDEPQFEEPDTQPILGESVI